MSKRYGAPALCDLESGLFSRLERDVVNERVEIDLNLPPWGSKMIVFGFDELVDQNDKGVYSYADSYELDLSGNEWRATPLKRHTVGAEDFIIKELTPEWRNAELGDWSEVVGEWFSGEVLYSTKFDVDEDSLSSKSVVLDLGAVNYVCDVRVNGEQVGRKAWAPYEFDVSEKIRPGTNTLDVIVANTLANALLDPHVEEVWYSKTDEPGWPSTGHPYEKRQRAFERESLASGLFGPVKLRFSS